MAEVDVLVVGGGLAGLAAALEAQRQGRSVQVLERASRLGGKAGSTQLPSGLFPDGPVSFNGRAAVFWRFLELLGAEGEVAKLNPVAGHRYLVRGGKLRAIKPNPLSLLPTGALPWGDRFSGLRESPPTSTFVAPEDESMRALFERRFGAPMVDAVFEAMFQGIFAGDLKELSVRSCLPALSGAEQRHGGVLRALMAAPKGEGGKPGLFSFTRGLGVIGEYAAKRVPHTCGVEVAEVSTTAAGVSVRSVDGRTFAAKRLVLACEAPAPAPLLASLAPQTAKELAAFDYAPVSLVQWTERTPGEARLPRGFGYLAAPREQLFALGMLFIGDLLDGGQRRFSSLVGGALQRDRAALPDDQLIEGVSADVQRLTGGVVGEVHRVVRYPRAVFQPKVGHLDALARAKAGLAGLPIALAGSYCGGAAMKDAIAAGFEAVA